MGEVPPPSCVLKAEFLEGVKSFEDFVKVDALFEDTRIKTV